MNKITIIGAGKTGRGFIADLVSDCEISFIDKNEDLVDELNRNKKFSVSYFGNKKPRKVICFKEAKIWKDVEKIDAEVIFVSVGGSNLTNVGNSLNGKISKNQRIIVCENASYPAKTLFEALKTEDARISEATVFCTTVEEDGLNINSEGYPYLQFDASPMKSDLPDLKNIKPVDNFNNFLNRKLYTYNSASCIIAYLGFIKGYTVYSEAANDEEILALLDSNYKIINECMCKEYGYTKSDQEEFALLSRRKFTDKTIVDTVNRNAREPQRKLKYAERLIGPLMLEAKYNKSTCVLEKTVAAALLYSDENDKEWETIKKNKGPERILTDICKLDKDSKLFKNILRQYDILKNS